jgi:hypothetical protein
MCNIKYDNEFMNIDFYKKYPQMLPWVGSEYDLTKILIIGESSYLCEKSSIHKDPKGWYSSSLNELDEK